MPGLSVEQKRKIAEALETAGARLPCPRCSNLNFTLVDGYFNQTVQSELESFIIGGPGVPTVLVVCNRCGYLSQHVLGVLLPSPQGTKEKG